MKAPKGPAAPSSGTSLPANAAPESGAAILAIPEFATLAADPEIAPLLNFEPVVRKIKRHDGWTPDLQRELIARIASAGTPQAAVWQMSKHLTGADSLYKTPTAFSFRMSWDAAVVGHLTRFTCVTAPSPFPEIKLMPPTHHIASRRASVRSPSPSQA